MAHIGSWDWNLITGEVCWSDELYHIFGRSPQESGATYDEFLSYVHPDDRDRVDNALKKGLNGESVAGNYRIILGDGEERIVRTEAEVVFDEKNNPVQVKGTVQDITEIKKVEEQLKILANIVESSNDAIGTISLDMATLQAGIKKLRMFMVIRWEGSGKACIYRYSTSFR